MGGRYTCGAGLMPASGAATAGESADSVPKADSPLEGKLTPRSMLPAGLSVRAFL